MTVFLYCCVAVLNGIGNWIFAYQFDPDMTTKTRIIGAVKFGLLWPFYWFKAILDEFL